MRFNVQRKTVQSHYDDTMCILFEGRHQGSRPFLHTNRHKHVAQLCRECCCPADKTDNHLANCKAKT